MSDTYQAIYDAARSRLACDVQSALESALRDAFGMASHHMACVAQEYIAVAHEQQRPSAIYRPAVSIDGNQWCALYGEDLQSGVAGFGSTPAEAMVDFDHQWMNVKALGAPNE